MKHIKTTDEKAIGYWTIVTNLLLVIFTFWLGIVVQSMVAQKNATVSTTLANMEYVEKVKPLVDSLNVKYGSLIMEFSSIPKIDKKGNMILDGADTIKAFSHFEKNRSEYADFFNDLAYTFSHIYKFDHNCPTLTYTTAKILPILSPMIKIIDTLSGQELWKKIEDTVSIIFHHPTYIKAFGLTLGNLDNTMGYVKQIFDKAVESNDAKTRLVVISQTYALSVFLWVSNHNYYNPPKNTSFIGLVSENPSVSLIVIVIIGLLIAWIVYRLHNWSTPIPKRSDIYLEKTANNIEGLRKETCIYRQDIEKVKTTIEDCITQVQDELTVLSIPIYDNMYKKEYSHVKKMIEAIISIDKVQDMPIFNEDTTHNGKEKYIALYNYSKQLEDYLRELRIDIPEK